MRARYWKLKTMFSAGILSDEFAEAAAQAGRRARDEALAAGFPVVFRDSAGRYVQELPDGRLFEVRFDPTAPRESHMKIVRELPSPAR
jgi:hypothetical protein